MDLLRRYPDRRDEEEKRKAAEAAVHMREMVVRLIAAALFFTLAGVVVAEVLSPERAWPVVVLSLAGAVVVLVPWDVWRALLARVEQAQIGPVSVGLRRDVESAAASAPPSDDSEDGSKKASEKAKSMLELRLRLEWKFAYVAKHLLAEASGPTFFTIGSLKYDGYLTESEARTAIGILSTGDERLRAMSPLERDGILIEAETFVKGVRASIFWGMVRRMLRGLDPPGGENLWVGDVDGKGRRDDMLARGGERGDFWVAPAFALNSKSSILRSTKKRLETHERPYGVTAERRIVVVPDAEDGQNASSDAGPKVVQLFELRDALTGDVP